MILPQQNRMARLEALKRKTTPTKTLAEVKEEIRKSPLEK